jgi:hypothetical protein
LTGDKKWQDRGWKMFVSWMQAAKVEGGISSIFDVTKDKILYGDNMESFTFAETFKCVCFSFRSLLGNDAAANKPTLASLAKLR